MISLLCRPSVRGLLKAAPLRRRGRFLLEAVEKPNAELVVVLTDDEEIAELNRQYRHKDGPTDVLSFPQLEGEHPTLPPEFPFPLGDVVISLETAARQAKTGCLPRIGEVLGAERAAAWSLEDEVAFLLLHGVLHLVGLDHMEIDDAVVMEAREAALLPELLKVT